MLTPEELKELREAYAESTPGEWTFQDTPRMNGTRSYSIYAGDAREPDNTRNDLLFTALSHNRMPSLLSAAEESAALKEKLERFALDALSALSTFTVTPVEGYLRAPHVLVLDIARLGKERDTLQQQLAESQAKCAKLYDLLSVARKEFEYAQCECVWPSPANGLMRKETCCRCELVDEIDKLPCAEAKEPQC